MQPEKSLVLIVGAGASKEFNLPMGSELKKQIAFYLNITYDNGSRQSSGDLLIDSALKRHISRSPNEPFNQYLEAAWRIRDAMPQAISIDNFIDSHRTNPRIALCAKLAIARSILLAEQNSSLYVSDRNIYNTINFTDTESTWIAAFFQLLTENCHQDDLPRQLSRVAIVCFNYDRCIEHYLYHALQNYYGISPQDAAEILSALEIHHPYGTVGALPWQRKDRSIEFGANPQSENLLNLSKELRTFTEGVDSKTSDILAIRSTIKRARRLAFLGFAFHSLNMELLFPGLEDGDPMRICPTYGTAYGISSADVQEIVRELSRDGGFDENHIRLRNDLPCSKLFLEFWRSLRIH